MDKDFWLKQWDAKSIRSTVLHPLQWMLYPLLIATIISAGMQVLWLTIALLALFIALLVLFGLTYVFALRTNPDLLRSEHHIERKIAIQHGLGDSLHGVTKSEKDLIPNNVESKPLLEKNSEEVPNE